MDMSGFLTEDSKTNPINYVNRSVLRAVTVINIIAQNTKPLTLTDISKESNLSKATVLRILSNLTRVGWIYKAQDERYSLGFKLLALSRNIGENLISSKVIHESLLRISEDTHESLLFAIWDGTNVVCVDRVNGSYPVSVIQKVHEVTPVHAGATGFAILLTMSEKDVRKIICKNIFEPYTKFTLTSSEDLIQKYNCMLNKGYVVSIEEKDEGVVGIATGIYLNYERMHASISIVIPKSRMNERHIQFLAKRLLQEKNYLTRIL